MRSGEGRNRLERFPLLWWRSPGHYLVPGKGTEWAEEQHLLERAENARGAEAA